MKKQVTQISQIDSTCPHEVTKSRFYLIPLILLLGLTLPLFLGAYTVNAAEPVAQPMATDGSAPSAVDDTFTILVSSIPTGTDNIDTPLTEYAAFTGTIDVATGGASFYPNDTNNSFPVTVPACSSGDKPVINGAYLEWYMRWRGPESIVDIGAGIPTFDEDLNLDINGNGDNSFTVTESFWARFDSSQSRAYYRRNAIIDITTQFDTDWQAGVNTIDVSGIVVPTPDSGTNINSEIYGVGVHVLYECPEFDYSRVGFNAGLDWFYELQDEPYTGDHSGLVCSTFPAAPADTTADLDSIMSGQANSTAPFRGARIFYITGSGPLPTADPTNATGPEDVAISTGDQIESGYESIWRSNLGTEWDQYNGEDVIDINAGDEWVCIQAESAEGEGSDTGISGDLLGVAISILLPQPTEYDLALIKQIITPGPYAIGQQITYQISVMNQGDVNSGDYEVTDVLPVELGFVSASPSATTVPAIGESGSIIWNATDLAPTEITTFTVVATIDSSPPAGSSIKNIAEITADSGEDDDSDPTDDSGSDDTFNDDDVTNDQDDNDQDDSDFENIDLAEYDLALIKRIITPGPYAIGQQITYQISVMNQGEVNSGDYEVTDVLPAELGFVSASPSATSVPAAGESGSIIWNATDLAPTEITTFTVVATIDSSPPAGSSIKNIAEITADSGDDDDSDPTDDSGSDDTFNDDDVTNDQDDNDQDDSDFENIDLAEYDLALIKRIITPGPYALGQQITYQISVMNQGAVNSGDYEVTDLLPAELGFVSASPSATSAPAAGASGPIVWNATDLAPSEITTFTVVATIDSAPATGTTIKNIADITADSGDDDDSDPTDDSGSDDTFNDDDVTNDQDDNDQDDSDFENIDLAEYDLALIKRIVTAGPYAIGQQITYQISVMNQGAVNSGDYEVTDVLPAELGFVSASPAVTSAPAVGESGSVVWNATNLAPGEIANFTLVATIDSAPAAGGPIKNVADITADSGEDDDSDPTDDSGNSDTINDDDVTNDQDDNDQDDSDFEEISLPVYDLALIKQIVTSGPYQVDQEITYIITVMNQGDINSGDFTVADDLPAELTFVSADPAPTSNPAVGQSGTVTWSGTNLAPGEMTSYSITVAIASDAASGGSIKNVADITSDSGEDKDSDPTDNSGDDDTFNDDDVTNDQDDNDQDDSDFEVIELLPEPTAVELEYFNGNRSGQQEATLRWQTASEVDNFGFRLLRSDDGQFGNATAVTFVESSISTGTAPGATYSYVDSLPGPGTYTYWLIDVDTFGVETVHGPVTVRVTKGWQLFMPMIVQN